MRNYFRIQQKHYSLSQMKRHNSGDGGDGNSKGICAVVSVSDLMRNTAFENFGSAEIVILNGDKVCDIYDGVRIRPTNIVAVFSFSEFNEKVADGSIYEYETF